MRMMLIQWFSPEFRTLEVSPLCPGKESLGESKCLWLVTHATLHSLPAVFLNWRRMKRKGSSSRPPTCSPLLPLQSRLETKGKQLGNLSDWPLLDWGHGETLAGRALNQLLSSGYTGAPCPLGLFTLSTWPQGTNGGNWLLRSPAVPATPTSPQRKSESMQCICWMW